MDLPTMAYMRRMEQPVRSGKGKIVRGLQSREMGKTPAFMRDVQEKMKQNERIHMGNYNTSVRRMQELTQERQQLLDQVERGEASILDVMPRISMNEDSYRRVIMLQNMALSNLMKLPTQATELIGLDREAKDIENTAVETYDVV